MGRIIRKNCQKCKTLFEKNLRKKRNRPLTFTYENPNDSVLTPNHLLFVRRLIFQVTDYREEENIDICSRYKHIQNLIEHFIKRWENEYLIELREFHKTKSRKKINELIRYLMLESLS